MTDTRAMRTMSLEQWTEWATADAERRGLHALKPLLEGLAAATARLRATEWHTGADRLSHRGTADEATGREH